MNIYLLERTEDLGYDEVIAQVIIANTPKEAIETCICGDEGYYAWVSVTPKLISKYTGKKKKPFILLTNFRNG